jgi:YaaC-like Protein
MALRFGTQERYSRRPATMRGRMVVRMAPRPWRQFTNWVLSPPHPGLGFDAWAEPATPEFLWELLGMEADIPERGRRLFTGTTSRKNALHREFSSYVRQAREYDQGARTVQGTSAALLHYYCAMNLAKAELLLLTPNPITGHRIRHGLRFSPTAARSIAGDYLQVDSGVFPLLYRKRTGRTLPLGLRLPIKRLMENIPEIGWELGVTGFATASTARLLHAVVMDGSQAWAMLAVDNPLLVGNTTAAGRLILQHFENVLPPPVVLYDWKAVFAISRRFGRSQQAIFEGRAKFAAVPDGSGNYAPGDFTRVQNNTWQSLNGIVDESVEEGDDASLSVGMYRAKLMPMPPSLARYALMFYVSSLVRYKPDQLDPRTHAQQQWMLAAFTKQSANHLVHAALSGIRSRHHQFYSRGAFRV